MSVGGGSGRSGAVVGLALLAGLAVAAWAEREYGWFATAFRVVAHLFYEQSALAEVRRPTQVPLARVLVAVGVGMVAAGMVAGAWLGPHGRRWWAVFCVGFAVRAGFWIAGGNLPLVPGDSCHYVEVATSVYRGEGPVKHYVESFFRDYPPIRAGEGVLDDWATPLWAYVLAGAYRVVGVVPGDDLTATFAVAKGTSFVLNLAALPVLYGLARRRFGPDVALGAMAALAVLPVHALYAGFGLRESLVALTAVLAVGTFVRMLEAEGAAAWGWAFAAGAAGGLAILARNTAMALLAAAGLCALVAHGRRRLGPLLAWGLVAAAVIAPWAYVTWREYGEPFYTYTKYFQYNFSWTVHHYQKGSTTAGAFYTAENLPDIVRVKVKSLGIVVSYSLMILSFPLALGFVHRLVWPGPARPGARDWDRIAAAAFVVFAMATLANIADVTQVQQLGRYYLPVYVLMLPTAAAGLRDWLAASVDRAKWSRVYAATVLMLWADPSWAYDASWLTRPFQLHWPAIREAGEWVREHPEAVPPAARIMTWFPWELRVASDRTTVLMPRALEAGAFEHRRVMETIRQYGVTHVLWGSFEPAPEQDPERLGPYLEALRRSLGLTDDRLLHESPPTLPHRVRLYRLGGS